MARIVLVADDSPTIQKRALGILKGEGFEVETVSNGVAAIKRLAVLHPVVVLADVSMPGRDGYEVCEFVKKSPDLSHVPVLLVASDMEPYDGPRGEQVGADGIIKKPFEARDLVSIVEKFAEQFEAATAAVAVHAAPDGLTANPESAREFPTFGEEPGVAPTIEQHAEPDFSAHAGGMAFTEPAGEEAHGFSYEPHPDHMDVQSNALPADAAIFPESAFEPPSALAAEQPLAAEAPPAPSPLASSSAPFYPERAPSFPEVPEATTPEPVFIEEQPAQPLDSSPPTFDFLTKIFRAPLEITEPVWNDETVPAAPALVSDGPMAFEPKNEAEAPAVSPDIPMEQISEPQRQPSAVTATSLDSFSLDEAATGQVHFTSEGSEVAHEGALHSTPWEEIPASEIAPSESVPEVVYSEPAAASELAPEAVHAEAAAPESAPEVVYSEPAAPELAPEAIHAEAAAPGAAPEVDYSEPATPELAPEAIHAEAAAPGAAPEVDYSEPATPELAPEAIHGEAAVPEAAPEVVYLEPAAASELALEAVHGKPLLPKLHRKWFIRNRLFLRLHRKQSIRRSPLPRPRPKSSLRRHLLLRPCRQRRPLSQRPKLLLLPPRSIGTRFTTPSSAKLW